MDKEYEMEEICGGCKINLYEGGVTKIEHNVESWIKMKYVSESKSWIVDSQTDEASDEYEFCCTNCGDVIDSDDKILHNINI